MSIRVQCLEISVISKTVIVWGVDNKSTYQWCLTAYLPSPLSSLSRSVQFVKFYEYIITSYPRTNAHKYTKVWKVYSRESCKHKDNQMTHVHT